MILHCEAAAPSLVAHLLTGDEEIEGYWLGLRPQTAGGTEIGDAAFSRDAGSGKGQDDSGLVHEFAKAANSGLKIGRDHIWWRSRRMGAGMPGAAGGFDT